MAKSKGKMTGAEVKQIREDLGMSYTELAYNIGVTYSSIRNLEHSPVINKTMELAIRQMKADQEAKVK